MPRLDWKFFITLLLMLAGVTVPVWIWQADQTAKGLQLEIISLTALTPMTNHAVEGLKFTLNDQLMVEPYLSVIELTNKCPLSVRIHLAQCNIFLHVV